MHEKQIMPDGVTQAYKIQSSDGFKQWKDKRRNSTNTRNNARETKKYRYQPNYG